MKKVLAGVMVLGMMFGAGAWPTGEAQAACAADWVMGDERVSFCGGALEDGTFTAKLEGDFENGFVSTVILENYKGPMFAVEGYGTGFPVNKRVIELKGENELEIPVLEGGGMLAAYELTGDGTLTVWTKNVTEGTGADDSQEENSVDNSQDEGLPDGSLGEDLPNDALTGSSSTKVWWIVGGVVVGVYIVGSLLAFAVIGVRSRKRKMAETATEVGAANGGAVADSASGEEPGDSLGSEE